jgi:hypothetical protein
MTTKKKTIPKAAKAINAIKVDEATNVKRYQPTAFEIVSLAAQLAGLRGEKEVGIGMIRRAVYLMKSVGDLSANNLGMSAGDFRSLSDAEKELDTLWIFDVDLLAGPWDKKVEEYLRRTYQKMGVEDAATLVLKGDAFEFGCTIPRNLVLSWVTNRNSKARRARLLKAAGIPEIGPDFASRSEIGQVGIRIQQLALRTRKRGPNKPKQDVKGKFKKTKDGNAGR